MVPQLARQEEESVVQLLFILASQTSRRRLIGVQRGHGWGGNRVRRPSVCLEQVGRFPLRVTQPPQNWF